MKAKTSKKHELNKKNKNTGKYIKRLAGILKEEKLLFIFGIVFASILGIKAIISPKLLGDIASEIQLSIQLARQMDFAYISKIGIILLIVYIVSAVLEYFQAWFMDIIANKTAYKYRKLMVEKINRMPLKYFDNTSVGEVLSKITNDVGLIADTLSQSLATAVTSIVRIIGTLIIMSIISWKMTLIAVLSLPVTLIVMLLFAKISQKYFKAQQIEIGNINGHIEEVYSAHNLIKVFNAEDEFEQKFDEIDKKIYKSAYKSQFLSGLMHPVSHFLSNVNYVLVCIVGAHLAFTGEILVGAIASFMLYIRQFNQPILNLASISSNFQSTLAAAERVFEFLEEEEEEDDSYKTEVIKKSDVKGKVEFKNVSFGYTKDKQIIKNFSFIAEPGQKIAIVGPTGAGKTTIVNLLMQFYSIDDGDILIDDISTKNMRRKDIRKLFGMVLQDSWIFEGTFKENISYGRSKVTNAMVEVAAQLANIDHFIRTLPEGYNKVISEKSNLSQGQKQLLTIARATIQNAPMLILDEATSSVDTRTEQLIQDAMDKLMKNRTSFIIAHRLSTIKNADKIIVMKDGKIVEVGNHEELLQKNGLYSEIYYSQFA